MKRKTKLFMTFSALCLVVALGVFGIFAVKTLNMTVGGNITFSAEGLDFSISKGTFETTAGAEYPGVNTDNTKLQAFAMNTNTKESDIATQKASWSGLNLTMSSLGDVVLVFTVTNNMTETLLTTIEVTTLGTNKNNNMEINVVGGTVTKGTPKEMSITFHIKDTNINAGLTGFAVAVSFTKETSEPGSTPNNPMDITELPGLTFTTTSTSTVAVQSNDASGDVFVPAYIRISIQTYEVTEIPAYAFYQNITMTSITIPSTIRKIGSCAFSYTMINEIKIPASVTEVADDAFEDSLHISRIFIDSQAISSGLTAKDSVGGLINGLYSIAVYLKEGLTPGAFFTSNECVYIRDDAMYAVPGYVCYYYDIGLSPGNPYA